MVVKPLDVFEQFTPRVSQISQVDMIRPFRLECSEERLGNRIVPAIALSAHTLDHLMPVYRLTEAVTAVLDALVRVDQKARPRSASIHGAFECGQDLLANVTASRQSQRALPAWPDSHLPDLRLLVRQRIIHRVDLSAIHDEIHPRRGAARGTGGNARNRTDGLAWRIPNRQAVPGVAMI